MPKRAETTRRDIPGDADSSPPDVETSPEPEENFPPESFGGEEGADPPPGPRKYPPGRPKAGEVRLKEGKLPKPPQMGMVPPLKFFKYWHDTDRSYPNRLQAYVYRRWPVTDREALGMKKYLEVLTVGDQLVSDDVSPEAAESTFLHRFGSGDYKIMLKDGGENKHISTCLLQLRDVEYPAIVEPLDSLDMSDPANRKFIEDCRRRGINLPGDPNFDQTRKDEENEMAQVTTELTDTVNKLVDKTMDMADRVAKSGQAASDAANKQAQDRQSQDRPPDVMATGLSMISQAAAMGTKIIESAVSKVGEIQAHSTPPPPPNPVEMMTGLVGLVKSMAGGNSAGNDVLLAMMEKSMTREREAHEAATAAVREQNQFMRDLVLGRAQGLPLPPGMDAGAAPLAPGAGMMGAAPVAPQPGGLLGQLKELSSVKTELQSLLGIGGEEAEELAGKVAGGAGWLERYFPLIMQGGMLLVTAFYNLAASRVGGQPIAPPTMDQGQGQPELPAPPMGAPPTATTDPTLASFHTYLAPMTEPLLSSLNSGESGYDFAAKLSDWAGSNTYNYLRELGPDKLLGIMSTYPPIWVPVSKIPARFTVFIQEFFAFGEGEADQGDANGAPQPGPQAPIRRVRTVPATGARTEAGGPRPVSQPNYQGAAPVPPTAS